MLAASQGQGGLAAKEVYHHDRMMVVGGEGKPPHLDQYRFWWTLGVGSLYKVVWQAIVQQRVVDRVVDGTLAMLGLLMLGFSSISSDATHAYHQVQRLAGRVGGGVVEVVVGAVGAWLAAPQPRRTERVRVKLQLESTHRQLALLGRLKATHGRKNEAPTLNHTHPPPIRFYFGRGHGHRLCWPHRGQACRPELVGVWSHHERQRQRQVVCTSARSARSRCRRPTTWRQTSLTRVTVFWRLPCATMQQQQTTANRALVAAAGPGACGRRTRPTQSTSTIE
ncbi:hypothetical protein U1Q18_051642 [Sarracenia purpurea var. burkii]